ncbi:MAG: ABC transporter ATP-binding protein [Candidatus Rokubacteria bacterium]|nr:ABC transporter ATP-binding protein [Candidatus Rokubacteria bacterium]
MALLDARSVSVAYGGLQALRAVDVAVEAHQIVGLLGPNGSGKTTLFNVLSGLRPPTSGDVWLGGERITRLPAWAIARRGIGRTFQIPQPFPRLRVRDNVAVGVTFRRRDPLRTGADRMREVERLLATVGLTDKADTPARELSLGERKRLELAVALSTRPILLLLDELASGLSPRGREEVIRFYARLRERGLTIFAIEHSFAVLAEVADRVLVLDQGAVIADGAPRDVFQSPRLARAYLGDEEGE